MGDWIILPNLFKGLVELNMNRSKQIYTDTLSQIKSEGLYKKERTIITPQGVIINTKEGGEVLNFCANNYLGLSNNPDIKAAAIKALDEHGFGMSSVRFIVEHRIFTRNWKEKYQTFSVRMIPYYTPPVLMPTEDYSRHFLGLMMPLFPMH